MTTLDAVLLAARRPGAAAVGVNLSEAGLVEVGQHDVTSLRLRSQLVDCLAGLGELGFISLFLDSGGCVSTPNPWP